MTTPLVQIPSLRSFLGSIALAKSTTKSAVRGLYSLVGGQAQSDIDVRDVVNALIASVDSGGGYTPDGTSSQILLGNGVAGNVPVAALPAGVAMAGPLPTLDANHVHAYMCSDTSGSLADIGSGTHVALAPSGTAGTNFVYGSRNPFRFSPALHFLGVASGGGIAGGFQATVAGMGSGAYTIECYAVVDAYITAMSTVNILVAIDDGSSSSNAFEVGIGSSGLIFAGTKVSGSDKNTQDGQSVLALPIGRPIHIMATYDASRHGTSPTLQTFVNGMPWGTEDAQTSALASMTRITLGNYGDLASECHAYVGGVLISNVARSQAYALAMTETMLSL